MLPLHHNFFLMNRRADISIFTSLLFLILFQGCVAKRLGKQAARFESAGMFAKAADLYYKASLKKPNVVEFKTGLRRSGQIHLEELSQLVNQAYINRDYHKAVYDFLALKGFLNKVKYAGVELNIDYSTQRIFENARELYLSDRYEYGQKLIGESDFDGAKKVFNEIHQILPDFRDTRSYLNMATIEPIYLRGVNLFSQRKYMDAYQEWEKVTIYNGGYKDVNSLMHQALNERYKEGVLFLINENFSAAALALGEVYKKNPKFEDVKNLYVEARNEPIYRSAMVDLNAGKCRAAYYGFEKVIADAGAYKNADAKRKRALDCAQYPIALATGKISDNQKDAIEFENTLINTLLKKRDPFLKIHKLGTVNSSLMKALKKETLIPDRNQLKELHDKNGIKAVLTLLFSNYRKADGALEDRQKTGFERKKITITTGETIFDDKKVTYYEYQKENQFSIEISYQLISTITGEILLSDKLNGAETDKIHYAIYDGDTKILYPAVKIDNNYFVDDKNYSSLQALLKSSQQITTPDKQRDKVYGVLAEKISASLSNFNPER